MALAQKNNMKWLKESHLGLKDVLFVTAETRSGPAVELKYEIQMDLKCLLTSVVLC